MDKASLPLQNQANFDAGPPRRDPVLSLVLGSRNDSYMGNSRWRLQTALNYVARQAALLGRLADVEVIVTDWGSEAPLQSALSLGTDAAAITSFVDVPPAIARELQKDSPFPEVLTVNAAARRASGQYIGRIDQDTLVGKRFLSFLFDIHEGRRQLGVPHRSALLFANQRMVPYRFVVRTPSFWAVEQYIGRFGQQLKIELSPRRAFYKHGVGIWLLHRELWHECGGYDERMIYANDQEINMIARLLQRHHIVDLGKLVDYDFYHMEHYHSLEPRRSARYRKVNARSQFASKLFPPDRFHPNSDDWGLRRHALAVFRFSGTVSEDSCRKRRFDEPAYLSLLLLVRAQIACDELILSSARARAWLALWFHRAEVARDTVRGQSVLRWPMLLLARWRNRQRAS